MVEYKAIEDYYNFCSANTMKPNCLLSREQFIAKMERMSREFIAEHPLESDPNVERMSREFIEDSVLSTETDK